MPNKNPLISIVIAVYNGEKYINDALKSIVTQSYKNFEIIIIDGGSKDGTNEIIKKYENFVSYYISEKDDGQSDAFNKGFSKCKGDVFAWLNADDCFTENAFQSFANQYLKHPDFDYYYSNYIWGDKNCNTLKIIKPLHYYSYYINKFYGCYIPTSGSFMKKSFFEKAGLLNINFKYKMDTEIFDRSRAVKFKKLKGIHSVFRFHGENVSFKDKSNKKDISKQDMESIEIKDRAFSIDFLNLFSIKTRKYMYNFIWYYFRFYYLTRKILSK